MYTLCKQIHPATTVEQCIYSHFYNTKERNLVIAVGNQLKIYRLVREQANATQTSEQPADPSKLSADEVGKIKLDCVQTIQLFSAVQGLQSVRLTGSYRDSLLLSFSEAKLSVVEYDPTTHDLKTVSLHYFEEEDMKQGYTHFENPPVIRVDPESRCAAMLVYGKNIVILPFRKDVGTSDEADTALASTIHPQEGASTSTKAAESLSVKSPVMASYKLNLSDDHYKEEKINNIIDIQFLYGYYEPTLLILHEPVRTWSGRVAVRQDTCAMVALSLDVHQRVHPIIWSTNQLPYDCFKALPVPKPVGGVLIMAINSLTYLNQSVPPYCVSLNGFTDCSSSIPMNPQKGVKLALDAAKACFLTNDKLVVTLKTGDLYVVTLFNDGMRSIRRFHFEKAAATVLTSCLVVCEESYLFLGSRLGNSLLLKYVEKPMDLPATKTAEVSVKTESEQPDTSNKSNEEPADPSEEEPEEPAKKKIKQEAEEEEDISGRTIGDFMAGDVALMKDLDELEVYGYEESTEEKLPTTLAFEVCDSIINIGPCGQICMGEPAFLSDEYSSTPDPQVELVTTSGFGKNGALCVLQRTVRPQVVTTFELPHCIDMWTVYGPAEVKPATDDEHTATEAGIHDFLILSRTDSTMILQTGVEMNELDHSGFSTQTTTVFVGNIGNNQYIVQVSPTGVRLLSGIKQLQHIPIDLGSPIAFASLADPFLFVKTENGQVVQLCLKVDATSGIARLLLTKSNLSPSKSTIVALCVYEDVSGSFTTESSHRDSSSPDSEARKGHKMSSVNISEAAQISLATTVDDEDELLYGSSSVEEVKVLPSGDATIPRSSADENAEAEKDTGCPIPSVSESAPTFWLFIVRDNGVLEIYSLPDFKLVYCVKNFPMGPKVLVDSVQSTDQQQESMLSLPTTREIFVQGMGLKRSRPLLFARFDSEIFIYESFAFYETQVENHLKLRFKRVNQHILIRNPLLKKVDDEKSSNNGEESEIKCWFRPFSDVAGYSGIFLCGYLPYWMFMTARGELRIHEMNIDGTVTCFAEFHNVNCPKGFLYFNKKNDLRIAILPTHVTYDAPWPVRKVPLRCTVHFVNYHLDSKCYCVVTSTLEIYNKIVRVGGEEKDYEFLERDSRYIWPVTEKFSIQLFSPVSWETIPGTKIELEEWEHVTCLKNVMLVSEGTESGLKGYIALGTNYCYGEDVTNRGRIWILDIIDVVPEPNQPLTRNKIKIVYCKEQKGPVTALCQVKGFLLSAIGQKIYIWQLKESQLVGVAFIDTQIYIHNAVSVKNLILIADVYKSISLLRYQEETRTLALVSKDNQSFEVYACEFMVDNNQLCFIVSDGDQNIIIYAYQPEVKESYGGTRLIRKADFHLGFHINSFFRIRCKVPAKVVADKRMRQSIENKHATMFATLDGSVGYVLPVSEKIYRRLLMLQNVMTVQLQHTAGLNPKASRLCKVSKKALTNPCKNILDGDLLFKFMTLSMNEKGEIAKKIGTSPDQVMDDLYEVERFTAHF